MNPLALTAEVAQISLMMTTTKNHNHSNYSHLVRVKGSFHHRQLELVVVVVRLISLEAEVVVVNSVHPCRAVVVVLAYSEAQAYLAEMAPMIDWRVAVVVGDPAFSMDETLMVVVQEYSMEKVDFPL